MVNLILNNMLLFGSPYYDKYDADDGGDGFMLGLHATSFIFGMLVGAFWHSYHIDKQKEKNNGRQ